MLVFEDPSSLLLVKYFGWEENYLGGVKGCLNG